jgi:hypothetical protein
MHRSVAILGALATTVVLTSVGLLGGLPVNGAANDQPAGYVAPASCGPGSHPEDGVQGEVPKVDRVSGRSQFGYSCNMTLLSQYQGNGAGWVSATYGHCEYIGSFFAAALGKGGGGVDVLDVSNPAEPRLTAVLQSTAMKLGTWESLKVDPTRGLLAATGVPDPAGIGALTFDIYNIKDDCAHPQLLNSLYGNLTVPTAVLGHEAVFSPDGRTYYSMSGFGELTAIDVSNPHQPKVLYANQIGLGNHGASLSPDGRIMYGVTTIPSAGVQILDVSDIQDRKPDPQVRQIGAVTWNDGLFSQMTIPFTSQGHHYLYAVDEAFGGGVRLLDIDDLAHPTVVREYRLAINRPSNAALRQSDIGGDGAFGYDAHYCSINRPVDPSLLACGYYESGVRLMDITNPLAPAEIGYFNPPAQVGKQSKLTNSPHAETFEAPGVLGGDIPSLGMLLGTLHPSMSADWCSSPPAFEPDNQLWVTCQDFGFAVLHYSLPAGWEG